MLYLNGGGYVVGSARMYRALAGYLARDSGAVVFTLDYRLAPEHVYPAPLDDAVAAFANLWAGTASIPRGSLCPATRQVAASPLRQRAD